MKGRGKGRKERVCRPGKGRVRKLCEGGRGGGAKNGAVGMRE